MQQIGRKADKSTNRAENAGTLDKSGASVVLPRALRKPIRQAKRLLTGGFTFSSKSIAIFGVCFVVVLGAAGLLAGNQTKAVSAKINAFKFLNVHHYDISGNEELSDVAIIKLLATKKSQSLLSYNVGEARENLQANPWVANATVSKVFPNKISVNIDERKAFAIWQQGEQMHLIDRDGHQLGSYDDRQNLPLIVGSGADKAAEEIIDALYSYPDLSSRVKAHIRIGDRRWDLELDNKIQIMLPEKDIRKHLQRLAMLNKTKGLFEREIERIDLRLPDRMILQLTETGAAQRKTLIDERDKARSLAKSRRQL